MSNNTNLHPLPVVGSKGKFTLAPPFDTIVNDGIEYTCHAVRRISDYLANNDQPMEEVYQRYGLTEDQYKEDLVKDVYIVSLQSVHGHWLYVPYQYVLSYPDGYGIRYQSKMINIALPSIYKDFDLTDLKIDLAATVLHSLGVDCRVTVVETSQPVLIDPDVHKQTQARRQLKKQYTGIRYKNQLLEDENRKLRAKVTELESYIIANHTP